MKVMKEIAQKKMTIGAICCFDDTSRHEIKLNMQH